MNRIESPDKFHEITNEGTYTIVKFYTTWCPDCRNLDRFIPKIIDKYQNITWFEMNAEDFPDIAEQYEVRGVPSLLLYRQGEKIGHLHSKFAKTPQEIEDFIQQHTS